MRLYFFRFLNTSDRAVLDRLPSIAFYFSVTKNRRVKRVFQRKILYLLGSKYSVLQLTTTLVEDVFWVSDVGEKIRHPPKNSSVDVSYLYLSIPID